VLMLHYSFLYHNIEQQDVLEDLVEEMFDFHF
jgi:hypothetical protein